MASDKPVFSCGDPLMINNKPAMGYNCCYWTGICVVYHAASTGDPDEPSDPPFIGDERGVLLYHGHSYDTITTPNGSGYHNHVWIMEWCLEDDDYAILEIEEDFVDWLPVGWSGGAVRWPNCDYDIETDIRDVYLDLTSAVGAGNFVEEDLYGPLDPDARCVCECSEA